MNRCPHCEQTHANTNHFCPTTGQPIPLGPRLIATKLLDKYKVLNIIGSGPIGIVLGVEEISTKTHFAAKLIHPSFTREDAEASKRFMDEATKVATLDCPHIAKIVNIGRDTGAAIAVIRELMTGECLASRIEQVGQFSMKAALSIVHEILLALKAMHAVNILNLDLSPADVFLSSAPNGIIVKLVDIGERHVKQALPPNALSNLDSTKYYAPEQYDRSRQPNHRSDIFAAGAILYHMLAGVIPDGNPKPLDAYRRDIPTAVSQLVMKAISPTPNNRFQNTSEFISAIETIDIKHPSSTTLVPPNATSEPTEDEQRPSVIVEMPEIQKSRRRIAAWTLSVLLAASGVAAWFAYNAEETTDPVVEADVTITIEIVPSNASIIVDGNRVGRSPAVINVPSDTRLHTIAAKADGFEPIERDVQFEKSKTVKLELMELIQPDDSHEQAVVATPAPTETPAASETSTSETDVQHRNDSTALNGKTTKSATISRQKNASADSAKMPSKAHSAKSQAQKQKSPVSDKAAKHTERKKGKRIKGFRTDNPFE